MPPRSEPLLWVQLIGVGVLPLEGLLLLLLLAGSDPGPVPGLERLLCWGLGGLAPTLLLWHRPADVWSLLLLQTPLRGRRPLQQRLSRLQVSAVLRLGLVLGGVSSLPLLWWLDDHAGVASSLSPLDGSPRLVVLLLAALLLALMLWQWQQWLQAFWLLTRRPAAVDAARPMTQAELEESRLSLGLPLLLLDPLRLDPVPLRAAAGKVDASPAPVAAGAEPFNPGPPPPPAPRAVVPPAVPASPSVATPEPSPAPDDDETAQERAGGAESPGRPEASADAPMAEPPEPQWEVGENEPTAAHLPPAGAGPGPEADSPAAITEAIPQLDPLPANDPTAPADGSKVREQAVDEEEWL